MPFGTLPHTEAMHRKPRKTRWASAAALLLAILFAGSAAQAAKDVDYSEVGWWQIRYRAVDGETAGCYAVAQFQDQTRVMLALIQTDASKNWVFFVENPNWNDWIQEQEQHQLLFRTGKLWRGTFIVLSNTRILSSGVTPDFMSSLAASESLTIWDEGRRLLTRISLKDSGAAIKAVTNCVREHPAGGGPVAEAVRAISGSAFFVAPNLLVTNNHVVKECKGDIQVRYPEGAPHAATIVARDEANDMALLRTDLGGESTVSFRLRPRLGEAVASYGFPYTGVLSSSGNFTLGNVTSLSGIGDDRRYMQVSTPTQPGSSGGPLLDMSGSVVGIVVGQLDADIMMQLGKSVPQNVNFAMQASVVVEFLASKGVTAKVAGTGAEHRDLPPADIADMAKKFTVRVYCPGTSRKTSEATGALIAARFETDGKEFAMGAAPRAMGKVARPVTELAARRLLRGPWHPLNGGSLTGGR